MPFLTRELASILALSEVFRTHYPLAVSKRWYFPERDRGNFVRCFSYLQLHLESTTEDGKLEKSNTTAWVEDTTRARESCSHSCYHRSFRNMTCGLWIHAFKWPFEQGRKPSQWFLRWVSAFERITHRPCRRVNVSGTSLWKFDSVLLIFAAAFDKNDRGLNPEKVQHLGVSGWHLCRVRVVTTDEIGVSQYDRWILRTRVQVAIQIAS